MEMYKRILYRIFQSASNIEEIAGSLRLDASGYFTHDVDAQQVALAGNFQIQLLVAAATTATVTFTEISGFGNGSHVVTVTNNDAVNAFRTIIDIRGAYDKAVLAGAGCSMVINFDGYCVGTSH